MQFPATVLVSYMRLVPGVPHQKARDWERGRQAPASPNQGCPFFSFLNSIQDMAQRLLLVLVRTRKASGYGSVSFAACLAASCRVLFLFCAAAMDVAMPNRPTGATCENCFLGGFQSPFLLP